MDDDGRLQALVVILAPCRHRSFNKRPMKTAADDRGIDSSSQQRQATAASSLQGPASCREGPADVVPCYRADS